MFTPMNEYDPDEFDAEDRVPDMWDHPLVLGEVPEPVFDDYEYDADYESDPEFEVEEVRAELRRQGLL